MALRRDSNLQCGHVSRVKFCTSSRFIGDNWAAVPMEQCDVQERCTKAWAKGRHDQPEVTQFASHASHELAWHPTDGPTTSGPMSTTTRPVPTTPHPHPHVLQQLPGPCADCPTPTTPGPMPTTHHPPPTTLSPSFHTHHPGSTFPGLTVRQTLGPELTSPGPTHAPDLIPDERALRSDARSLAHLLRDARREAHGRDPPRLRHDDVGQRGVPGPQRRLVETRERLISTSGGAQDWSGWAHE